MEDYKVQILQNGKLKDLEIEVQNAHSIINDKGLVNEGSLTTPVYFSGGVPVACNIPEPALYRHEVQLTIGTGTGNSVVNTTIVIYNNSTEAIPITKLIGNHSAACYKSGMFTYGIVSFVPAPQYVRVHFFGIKKMDGNDTITTVSLVSDYGHTSTFAPSTTITM